MRKKSFVQLRNQILKALNGPWAPVIHVSLFPGSAYFRNEFAKNKFSNFPKLLIGYHKKDGRMVVVLPYPRSRKSLPYRAISELMHGVFEAGGIAGVAYTLGDAFDILVDDELEYPRNKRTFYFEKRLKQGNQGEEE